MASTQTPQFQTSQVLTTLFLVLVLGNQVKLQLDNGRLLLFLFDFQLLKQIFVTVLLTPQALLKNRHRRKDV